MLNKIKKFKKENIIYCNIRNYNIDLSKLSTNALFIRYIRFI